MPKKTEETRLRDGNAAEGAMLISDRKRLRREKLNKKKLERKCMASHAPKSDIRNIMKGVRKRKLIPAVSKNMVAGDFSEDLDLMKVMNKIEEGKEVFRNMPSQHREMFNNDPIKFMQFVQNPKKTPAEIDRAVEIGLFKKRVEPKAPDPQKVVVVADERPKKEEK